MITPTQELKKTFMVTPRELPTGCDAITDFIVGLFNRRKSILSQLERDAQRIDLMASEFKKISDHRLKDLLEEHRGYFKRQKNDLDTHLLRALALVREACERCTGLRPYNVQLMGALALHKGYLIEMVTGEGKTLVASLAAVLSGWTQQPCHIITVNDYLAQRDAEGLRHLYEFCGLSVGYVTGQMKTEERRSGYAADITYTTSKELLADFLRDRLQYGSYHNASRRFIRNYLLPKEVKSQNHIVMRGIHTAIIDEADSILIDEAVTPLIISQPSPNKSLVEACINARRVADALEKDVDYTINSRYKEIELTDEGRAKAKKQAEDLGGLWKSESRWLELIKQALTSQEFFLKKL